jgi:hypothetical protein
MEAIEAVLELAKERDQIADELETYEDWFESLVGRKVTLSLKQKSKQSKIRFVECVVTEFVEGEGWELTSCEGDEQDEVFMVTLEDIFIGKATIHQE